METTERVVEAYCRYVKGWATIPNIRCEGQYEIDLLAIDPVTLDRYHIESGISVSEAFSKLTDKAFSTDLLKQRVHAAGQRRTVGYFVDRKFGSVSVIQTLAKYGFRQGEYARVIVSWGWTAAAQAQAEAQGVLLWDFRELVRGIAESFRGERSYLTDDTVRTLHLYALATTGVSLPRT